MEEVNSDQEIGSASNKVEDAASNIKNSSFSCTTDNSSTADNLCQIDENVNDNSASTSLMTCSRNDIGESQQSETTSINDAVITEGMDTESNACLISETVAKTTQNEAASVNNSAPHDVYDFDDSNLSTLADAAESRRRNEAPVASGADAVTQRLQRKRNYHSTQLASSVDGEEAGTSSSSSKSSRSDYVDAMPSEATTSQDTPIPEVPQVTPSIQPTASTSAPADPLPSAEPRRVSTSEIKQSFPLDTWKAVFHLRQRELGFPNLPTRRKFGQSNLSPNETNGDVSNTTSKGLNAGSMAVSAGASGEQNYALTKLTNAIGLTPKLVGDANSNDTSSVEPQPSTSGSENSNNSNNATVLNSKDELSSLKSFQVEVHSSMEVEGPSENGNLYESQSVSATDPKRETEVKVSRSEEFRCRLDDCDIDEDDTGEISIKSGKDKTSIAQPTGNAAVAGFGNGRSVDCVDNVVKTVDVIQSSVGLDSAKLAADDNNAAEERAGLNSMKMCAEESSFSQRNEEDVIPKFPKDEVNLKGSVTNGQSEGMIIESGEREVVNGEQMSGDDFEGIGEAKNGDNMEIVMTSTEQHGDDTNSAGISEEQHGDNTSTPVINERQVSSVLIDNLLETSTTTSPTSSSSSSSSSSPDELLPSIGRTLQNLASRLFSLSDRRDESAATAAASASSPAAERPKQAAVTAVSSWKGFEQRVQGSVQMARRLSRLQSYKEHTGCVNSLNFNESGTWLASGSDDLHCVIWDWSNSKVVANFSTGHRLNVFQAKFLPYTNDIHLITSSRDGMVRLALLSTSGECKGTKKLAAHKGPCHKIATLPDNSDVFYSCGEDSTTYRIDLREKNPTKCYVCKISDRRIPLYSIHTNPFNSNEHVVGGRDQYIRVYDVRHVKKEEGSGACVKKFSPPHLRTGSRSRVSHLTCVVYNYNGKEILGSYNDENIYLFNNEGPDTAEPLHKYEGHRNSATIKGVNFYGPHSEFIVSGSDCGNIFVWERESEQIINYFHGDDAGIVNVLEPHPNLPVLATSGLDEDVKLWAPLSPRANPMSGLNRVVRKNRRDRLYEFDMPSSVFGNQMLWYLTQALRNTRRNRRVLFREFPFNVIDFGNHDDSSSSSSDSSDSSDGRGGARMFSWANDSSDDNYIDNDWFPDNDNDDSDDDDDDEEHDDDDEQIEDDDIVNFDPRPSAAADNSSDHGNDFATNAPTRSSAAQDGAQRSRFVVRDTREIDRENSGSENEDSEDRGHCVTS